MAPLLFNQQRESNKKRKKAQPESGVGAVPSCLQAPRQLSWKKQLKLQTTWNGAREIIWTHPSGVLYANNISYGTFLNITHRR